MEESNKWCVPKKQLNNALIFFILGELRLDGYVPLVVHFWLLNSFPKALCVDLGVSNALNHKMTLELFFCFLFKSKEIILGREHDDGV